MNKAPRTPARFDAPAAAAEAVEHAARQGGDGARAPSARELALALSTRYGEGVARAVMNESGIDARSEQLVDRGTFVAAVNMARRAESALSGVNLPLRMSMSAVQNGTGFRAAAARAGVEWQRISVEHRSMIDAEFDRAFADHAAANPGVVGEQAATQLMARVLKRLLE